MSLALINNFIHQSQLIPISNEFVDIWPFASTRMDDYLKPYIIRPFLLQKTNHLCACVCFNQHHELMGRVCLWEQRHNLWCFNGRKQSRRHSTVLTVTRNPVHLQRTQSQWMSWLPDHATRSQCGLLAGRVLSVTTLPALNLPVCLDVSYLERFLRRCICAKSPIFALFSLVAPRP